MPDEPNQSRAPGWTVVLAACIAYSLRKINSLPCSGDSTAAHPMGETRKTHLQVHFDRRPGPELHGGGISTVGAFARPKTHEVLDAETDGIAIRLPADKVFGEGILALLADRDRCCLSRSIQTFNCDLPSLS